MKTPLFSVIVPVHNAAEYMRKGLDSIKAQEFGDYELIIVCDACEDDSEKIARKYADKVIVGDWHNEGPARNAGLDAATGDWVIWMDDDDWFVHEYAFGQIAERIGDYDQIRIGFLWKEKGYTAPGDWIAVWTKVWRRAFIDRFRFGTDWPADWPFYLEVQKHPMKITHLDMPIYYYNYMREGSQTWEHQS